MAWEWSHAPEAYTWARRNLERLPDSSACVIFAEWRAAEFREHGGADLNLRRYTREFRRAWSWIRRGRREEINAFIWERAASWEHGRTCDNGGWNAWLCPFGCGCHVVPFGPTGDYIELCNEFRASRSGDRWGDAMSAFFDVAAELYHRGAGVPAEWEYRPGACGDPREPGSALFDACEASTDEALAEFGNTFHRYTEMLRAAGAAY